MVLFSGLDTSPLGGTTVGRTSVLVSSAPPIQARINSGMCVPTVHIDNLPFRHSLPSQELADVLALIAGARTITNGLTTQLLAGIKANDAGEAAHARDLLINSPEARLASAINANKKLRPDLRQSLERCLAVPALLDFTKPLNEPVPVYPKAKKSGGCRMIHNPRLMHRTGQDIVARIMGAYYVPRPRQFTQRGVQAAVRQIKQLLKMGQAYYARLDIKDFYPSFDPDKLVTELPLPQGVVENVVIGRHMKAELDKEFMKSGYAGSSIHHTHDDLLTLARLGIPQGSGCSPIIGSYSLSRLAWPAMPDAHLVNYADDFLLLSESPLPLGKAVGTLTGAVAKLPDGYFDLKLKAEGAISKEFAFLGHRFQFINGALKVSPTLENLEDIWRKVGKIDHALSDLVYAVGKHGAYDKQMAMKHVAHMVAVVAGWLSAFSECDDVGRAMQEVMFGNDDWCKVLGVTLDKAKEFIEPSMDYQPSDYTFGH